MLSASSQEKFGVFNAVSKKIGVFNAVSKQCGEAIW
jgi:hypothetical protein